MREEEGSGGGEGQRDERAERDFPPGPEVKTLQGTWVQSLVGEQKKKREREKE